MITDSTERLLNQKLREIDSYKEELLNSMMHITKTPLNSIISLSELTLPQLQQIQNNFYKEINK